MYNDIDYSLLLPPHGLDYYHMTKAEAQEDFEWFVEHIPERMDYFRTRCASDLRVPQRMLDYSADSMLLVWKWFLKTMRMVPTPRNELERMRESAKIFGDSYVNKEVFSVSTTFIMRDIGMYVGETYIRNYSPLYWSYFTSPKRNVAARKPIVAGFWAWVEGHGSAPAYIDPIGMVEGAASQIYRNAQEERDLYELFFKWIKYVPHCDKHSKRIPWSRD